MMKAYAAVEVALFSFLTLALDEMTGQLHALATPCPPHQPHPTTTVTTTTRKSPQYPLKERTDGLQS